MQKDLFLEERHIIPISGKDSLATALWQIAKEPDLPYEFMFNPTGAELPEVFDWLNRVENYLGKPIVRVGKNLEYIITNERGGFLPSWNDRFCTKQSKMTPMENYIGSTPCFVYYGIRADENRAGYSNASKRNIYPKMPLIEAGINLRMVYQIIKNAGLKPPTFFWQEVYDEVCKRMNLDLKEILPEWIIDLLFSWRTRANCYFCFNQRKYEWVGLLRHEPELFRNAMKMEHNGSDFYWNGKDYPLQKIIDNQDAIIEKRIKAIIKIIEKIIADGKVVMTENEDDERFIDILSITSCGLICGK